MSDNSINLSLLPWMKISKLIKSGQFASISTETLEFAIDEQNYEALVKSALESLKVSDPDKANLEYAAKVADMMKEVSSQVLNERKSN